MISFKGKLNRCLYEIIMWGFTLYNKKDISYIGSSVFVVLLV